MLITKDCKKSFRAVVVLNLSLPKYARDNDGFVTFAVAKFVLPKLKQWRMMNAIYYKYIRYVTWGGVGKFALT